MFTVRLAPGVCLGFDTAVARAATARQVIEFAAAFAPGGCGVIESGKLGTFLAGKLGTFLEENAISPGERTAGERTRAAFFIRVSPRNA
jgi:hypothetical protein